MHPKGTTFWGNSSLLTTYTNANVANAKGTGLSPCIQAASVGKEAAAISVIPCSWLLLYLSTCSSFLPQQCEHQPETGGEFC